MKSEPLYYIPMPENDHDVAGPYDLVQMARLLRTNIITADTLTYREGETDWLPFGHRPQFIIAKEMPPDAVSTRLVMLKEQEAAAKHGPIPLPSVETMVKLGATGFALLIGAVIAYVFGAGDPTMGMILTVVFGGVALVGQAFILVRLMDETWLVRLMVLFIPFFDIYYFMSNLEKYWFYFAAKYAGGILAAATFAGLASVDAHQADEMESILSLFRLG